MLSNIQVRVVGCAAVLVVLGLSSFAQTTVATGSIQGTLTDPTGAAVSGAKVVITNKGTGQKINRTSNSDGLYNSGALPGEYSVRVEAAGFSSAELNVTVQVGNTASGSVKLATGQASQTVEVTSNAVGIHPDQATVQRVLTAPAD